MDAAALLVQADEALDELQSLIRRVKRTTATTDLGADATMTDVLARRDVLALRHAVVTAAADAASGQDRFRQLRSELRRLSALPVAELRTGADRVARELDVRIRRGRSTCWTDRRGSRLPQRERRHTGGRRYPATWVRGRRRRECDSPGHGAAPHDATGDRRTVHSTSPRVDALRRGWVRGTASVAYRRGRVVHWAGDRLLRVDAAHVLRVPARDGPAVGRRPSVSSGPARPLIPPGRVCRDAHPSPVLRIAMPLRVTRSRLRWLWARVISAVRAANAARVPF